MCFFIGAFTVFRHITASGIQDLCITRATLFIGIIKRNTGKILITVNFVPMFKAEKFDAEKWVSILKSAGAKYIMPVGEHHDGYKMYDSDLSQWTSVKQAPHCDIWEN